MKFRLLEELTNDQEAFFRNSKIRYNNGQLRTLYHASGMEFRAFDKSKIGSGSGGSFGNGFYFGYNAEFASTYGDNVKAYYLNITNPYQYYNLDCFRTLLKQLDKLGVPYDKDAMEKYIYENEWDFDPMDALLTKIDVDTYMDTTGLEMDNIFTDLVHMAGYDGIDEWDEVIAFEPNQIKLVTNEHPTNSDYVDE